MRVNIGALALFSASANANVNAAQPTQAPDHFQQIGIAAGAVYSSLGSVMGNPNANYYDLARADNEATRAIASLKQELRYYDWEGLLGEEVGKEYRSQLQSYLANLDIANREVHSRAAASWSQLPGNQLQTPVQGQGQGKAVKAATKTTALAISLGTTASSLLPVPSDMFSDNSGQAYQVPTVASFNQSPSSSAPTTGTGKGVQTSPDNSDNSDKASSDKSKSSSSNSASTSTSGSEKLVSSRTRTSSGHHSHSGTVAHPTHGRKNGAPILELGAEALLAVFALLL